MAKSPTSIDARSAVLERQPLQFERQRAHRGFDMPEALARLRPFALARIGERAPELRVVLVADHRIAEILERGVGAVEHDVGDGAQHQRARILGGRPLVGDRDVEHRLGLGEHFARQIEAREFEPLRVAPARRRVGGGAR